MPSAFFYIDQIYAALFLIELVLRMISEGGPPFFFKSPNIAWNYLDLMINATSVLNLVSAVASTSNQDAETIKASGNMRIIRILRLTRIIRVVRIVKIVRFIRALRSLVDSIFCTMKVLLWSVLLLVMIMYVFAIVFTDVSSEYSRGFEEISEANLKFIREHFLDLERSIMTLFQSICNGIAWGEVADKLNELSRIWGYLYVTYIAFCLFAVLNVMTGMFCQSAIESAERDQELHIQTVLSTKQQQIETFMSMFERLQHDLGRRPTGNLTFMEFEELFCKPHIRSFFEALDVETKDAWTLFNLMDVSGSGDLEASEFVEGCMRLKGPARAIDVSLMIREQRRTRKKLLGRLAALLTRHRSRVPMHTPVESETNDWTADWESRMDALLLANNVEDGGEGTLSGTLSSYWEAQLSASTPMPSSPRARPPSVIHAEIPENKAVPPNFRDREKASSSRLSRSSLASGRSRLSKQSATASTVSDSVFGRMFHVTRKPRVARSCAAAVDSVSMTSFDTNEEQMHKETLRESQKKRRTQQQEHLGQKKRSVVASWSFEAFFALAIFSNSIFIGVEVHYAAHHANSSMPPVFFYIDQIYAGLFLVELVLRVMAEGRPFFFRSPNLAWNYLDLMINATSVLNLVSAVASTSSEDTETIKASGNMRIIRILRLTRVIRVVRIVKIVRFIRALRSLVHSIFGTMKVLLWSVLLLIMIMYVFAIVFTDVSNEYSSGFEEISEEHSQFLRKHFFDLERSIITLFQSICNGLNWGDVADKLNELSRVWGYLYIIYIAFCMFAVLNVMTGMFCQSAIESAERDQELHIQAVLSTKQQQIETFMSMFEMLQQDLGRRATGNLTFMEFEELFDKPHIRSFFEALDVETKDAWTLFNLMDISGSGDLEASEFVEGCMRLKGPARAIDVSLLLREQRRTRKKLLGRLVAAVGSLDGSLNAPSQGRGRIAVSTHHTQLSARDIDS
ncbi:L type [Durusdinium trenchii]|uniref:L type n=1 Tax=Durusdinium trenchii TaxID=1381693 RepID=A0ABP0RQ41_9DINO